MEIRCLVALSSSWGISGDLQNVLFIRNSTTGVHLDEPLSSERSSATPLTLTLDRPDSDEPCYLNVDLTGLRGYLPSALELLSESRTIEVYDRQRDEYLDTVRGIMVKTQDGCRLYSCVFDLSSDSIFNNISVKLLSLKGKERVHVSKLLLDVTVTEDHGGSREESSSKSSSVYHHELLSSLASQNLPPLLRSLVSSLQSTSSRDPGSNAPSDLIGMSHALRQVHSVLSPPVDEPQPTTEIAIEEPNSEEQATVSDETVSQVDQELLSKLEERLKTYIDTKFAELEKKIETRLERIFTDRVNGPPPSQPHVDSEETNCYGLVEDLSQLD